MKYENALFPRFCKTDRNQPWGRQDIVYVTPNIYIVCVQRHSVMLHTCRTARKCTRGSGRELAEHICTRAPTPPRPCHDCVRDGRFARYVPLLHDAVLAWGDSRMRQRPESSACESHKNKTRRRIRTSEHGVWEHPLQNTVRMRPILLLERLDLPGPVGKR